MFASDSIYGEFEMSIDSKGRMIIPASAKAEETDELLVIKNDDYYEIIRKEEIDNLIKKLEEQMESTKNIEELQNIKKMIISICSNIIRQVSPDKQGRIILGKEFIEESKVKVIGARKSLIIKTKGQSL